MDERRADVIDLINTTAQLLRSHGEQRWAAWLERNASFIHNRDFYGVEQLLGGYAGMGSFNDVVIHPINGHRVAAHELAQVNERFQTLKAQLYALADALKREHHA